MKYSAKDTLTTNLPAIADCHISAFPDSFTSKLGRKYLTKMFEWYLVSDKAFLYHISQGNEIIGYCGGIIKDGTLATGSLSAMTQYSFKEGLTAFIMRPYLWFDKKITGQIKFIFRNLIYRIKKPTISETDKKTEKESPHIGLVVIGVRNSYQGKGYGSILLKEFENRSIEMGIKELRLSVRASNEKAIHSYKLNNWKKIGVDGDSWKMSKILL